MKTKELIKKLTDPKRLIIMAGPCAVEDEGYIEIAKAV